MQEIKKLFSKKSSPRTLRSERSSPISGHFPANEFCDKQRIPSIQIQRELSKATLEIRLLQKAVEAKTQTVFDLQEQILNLKATNVILSEGLQPLTTSRLNTDQLADDTVMSSTGSSFHSETRSAVKRLNVPVHDALHSFPTEASLTKKLQLLESDNEKLTVENAAVKLKHAENSKRNNELTAELSHLNEQLEALKTEQHFTTITHEEELSTRQAQFLRQITELHSRVAGLELLKQGYNSERDALLMLRSDNEDLQKGLARSQCRIESLTHVLLKTQRQLEATKREAREISKLAKETHQVANGSVKVHSDLLVTMKFRIEKLYKQLMLEMDKSNETDISVYSFGTAQFTRIERGLNEVAKLIHESIESILGEGPKACEDECTLTKRLRRQATVNFECFTSRNLDADNEPKRRKERPLRRSIGRFHGVST